MPYTEIKKEKVDGKDKWCFKNKSTGQRICADTYEKAVAAMRLRYHIDSGGKVTKAKKS